MTNTRSSLPSAWQTLAEINLPNQPGAERLARDHVVTAVRPLNLSPAALERLKTAVAEVVLKIIEPGTRYPANPAVYIQLRIFYKTPATQITDQETASSPDELTAKMFKHEPLQGLGFFLIERRVDDMQIAGDDAQHSIELFLYRE